MDKDCRSCAHLHMFDINRLDGDDTSRPPYVSIVQKCFNIDNATFVHDIDFSMYKEKHNLYCDNFKPDNLSAQDEILVTPQSVQQAVSRIKRMSQDE